ncbi:hypothetical protein VSDG_09743 [Cytospora chrysosperma]|uniref:MEI5 protein n=1 Tax=Cytospora chrysosperma TaxID=252740 RepID=A0A423VA08_CYTCH|nr:hypothetical protein VSDG_09743 [Valsa sordida]
MASSISTTKPVTNGHDLDPPEQHAAGVIESLVKAVKVLSCDESYQALGKVVEDNVSLKARNEEFECKTKEWDITKREMFATINTVQSEAKKAKALFSQKVEELQKSKEQEAELREMLGQSREKVEDLKKELEANGVEISKTMRRFQNKEDEIRKLNVSLDKTRKDLKECQKTASATQKELTEMREQYGRASQDLADLRGVAFPLTKVESKSSAPAKLGQLDSLSEGAYKLATAFFSKLELADGIFRGTPWQNLKSDSRLANIPLPPTNSQPARQMRAAAALRLIALAAVEHIFQPVYLTEAGGELGEVLDDVYALDWSGAQRVRSVLLNIKREVQAANGKRRVEAASMDVFESVGPLLVSPDGSLGRQAEFRRDLQAWCDKARVLWTELQELEGKFTVLFEEDKKSLRPEDWRRIPDEPTPPKQGSAPASGAKAAGALTAEDIVTLLWPAFFVSKEKDGRESTQRFKGGYVLVKPQVVAARREVANARSLRIKQQY